MRQRIKIPISILFLLLIGHLSAQQGLYERTQQQVYNYQSTLQNSNSLSNSLANEFLGNNFVPPSPFAPQDLPIGNNATSIMLQPQQQRNKVMGQAPPLTESEIQASLKNKANAFSVNQWEAERNQIINEIRYDEMKSPVVNMDYSKSPEFSAITQRYVNARNEILEMLQAKKTISVKRATWLVENAYLGEDKLPYDQFCKGIESSKKFMLKFMQHNGYDPNSDLSKNWTIQKFMADTIILKNTDGTEIEHNPMSYDFEDCMGEKDLTKLFVSKLMKTNTGQCYTLPRYYRIMAEELGAKAWIARSPNHTYIIFQDNEGNRYNYETTNGHLITDASIMRQGYVSAMSIKSRVHMDTLSPKQILAMCLNDLADDYRREVGSRLAQQYIETTVDSALKYDPSDAYFQMSKSNLYLRLMIRKLKEKGVNHHSQLPNDKEVQELWAKHDYYYTKVKMLGYEKKSIEEYKEWLKQLDGEQEKKFSENIERKLIISIDPPE